MTNDEITRYIQEHWSDYSRGLVMSFAFRKDKNYNFNDVKDAYESGAWELIQLLHRNNINIDDLKYE